MGPLLAAGGNRRTRQAQREQGHGQIPKPACVFRDGLPADPTLIHNQDCLSQTIDLRSAGTRAADPP